MRAPSKVFELQPTFSRFARYNKPKSMLYSLRKGDEVNRVYLGIFATVGLILGTIGTLAAETADPGRYTMRQTDNGFLRLDTQTGAVSVCASEGNTWSCRGIEDDSQNLQTQIAELSRQNNTLQREIARLKNRLRELEDQEPAAGIYSGGGVPNEQDVDKAFTFLEGVLKRFKGLVEDLREEKSGGTQL